LALHTDIRAAETKTLGATVGGDREKIFPAHELSKLG
jgi:hypothetical protein